MISDFPLYIFTVLTGLAAGGYVGAAVLPKQAAKADRSWVFPAPWTPGACLEHAR